MTTPKRGLLFHFTHVSNLVSIALNGLRSDNAVRDEGCLETDIGEPAIKDRRQQQAVPEGPGGFVADYVPFYFAARSPMLGSLYKDKVALLEEIVYLVTSVDRLVESRADLVFTDRNAALNHAKFSTDATTLDHFIDWSLMEGRMWNDTHSQPDRKERRMAECLAHGHVPWDALIGVATQTEAQRRHVEDLLSRVGTPTTVLARPGWYFP